MMKILMLIKWSNRSSQLLNLEWLSYFKHVVQSLLNRCLLVSDFKATPNHILLKYRCLMLK